MQKVKTKTLRYTNTQGHKKHNTKAGIQYLITNPQQQYPEVHALGITHQGRGAVRNTRTTPSRKINLEILTNLRDRCPAKESLKPIEEDASRTEKKSLHHAAQAGYLMHDSAHHVCTLGFQGMEPHAP